MTEQKIQSFWQIWNMNIGFFGVQYSWALQMANTSAIYEYLGANPEQIPMLWLAAPLSGLIVQPIIGYMSDHTWGPLGRRRPYFLLGAIFSSVALILMPNSSSLWMAAGWLWILDTTINITMEPFRAFIADLLPRKQYTRGFSMQSFFIGSGAVMASLSPWILTHLFHVDDIRQKRVPSSVKLSFYIGAVVLLTTVIWTVVSTSETPPKNLEKIQNSQKNKSILDKITEFFELIKTMPIIMKKLAVVQFFTWVGIFCVFLYFPTAIAHHIFGAVQENSQLYADGIEWAGICIAVYNGVCFIFSWLLPTLTEIINYKITHSLCLICGGVGLISLMFVDQPLLILLPMVGFGIAWSSILTIPYSLLSRTLTTQNTGLYMGIFNSFIVIPQIFAALGLGWIMKIFFDTDYVLVLVMGGCFLLVAAISVYFVNEPETSEKTLIKL